MRRRIPFSSAIVSICATLLVVVVAPTAQATDAGQFVSKINGERTSRGLGAYAVRSDLAGVAARQAARMASSHSLYHNPRLESEVANWREVGENVGQGSTVSSLHSAFMASSGHRANILSGTFTEVGVGTARGSDGKLYVSEVFRLPAGASVPARPRVVRRTPRTLHRASRSAPRRQLPVVVRRPAPRLLVNPMAGRLKAAWIAVRRERPVGSIERVAAYARSMNRLG